MCISREMTDFHLFSAYEMDDPALAASTRATLTAEFLNFCRAVGWMMEAFGEDDVYGQLCHDVNTEALKSSMASAMNARAALSRKARHQRVGASSFGLWLIKGVRL